MSLSKFEFVSSTERLVEKGVITCDEGAARLIEEFTQSVFNDETLVTEMMHSLRDLSDELIGGLKAYLSRPDSEIFTQILRSPQLHSNSPVPSFAIVDYCTTPFTVTVYCRSNTKFHLADDDPFPTVVFALREHFSILNNGNDLKFYRAIDKTHFKKRYLDLCQRFSPLGDDRHCAFPTKDLKTFLQDYTNSCIDHVFSRWIYTSSLESENHELANRFEIDRCGPPRFMKFSFLASNGTGAGIGGSFHDMTTALAGPIATTNKHHPFPVPFFYSQVELESLLAESRQLFAILNNSIRKLENAE